MYYSADELNEVVFRDVDADHRECEDDQSDCVL